MPPRNFLYATDKAGGSRKARTRTTRQAMPTLEPMNFLVKIAW